MDLSAVVDIWSLSPELISAADPFSIGMVDCTFLCWAVLCMGLKMCHKSVSALLTEIFHAVFRWCIREY
jgi:hypothetical protein